MNGNSFNEIKNIESRDTTDLRIEKITTSEFGYTTGLAPSNEYTNSVSMMDFSDWYGSMLVCDEKGNFIQN